MSGKYLLLLILLCCKVLFSQVLPERSGVKPLIATGYYDFGAYDLMPDGNGGWYSLVYHYGEFMNTFFGGCMPITHSRLVHIDTSFVTNILSETGFSSLIGDSVNLPHSLTQGAYQSFYHVYFAPFTPFAPHGPSTSTMGDVWLDKISNGFATTQYPVRYENFSENAGIVSALTSDGDLWTWVGTVDPSTSIIIRTDTATVVCDTSHHSVAYCPYSLCIHRANEFWVGTNSAIVLTDTSLTFLRTRARDMPSFDIRYLGNALYWRDSTGMYKADTLLNLLDSISWSQTGPQPVQLDTAAGILYLIRRDSVFSFDLALNALDSFSLEQVDTYSNQVITACISGTKMLTVGKQGWLDGFKPYGLNGEHTTPYTDIGVSSVWEDTVVYNPLVGIQLSGIHVMIKNQSAAMLDTFDIQLFFPEHVSTLFTTPCNEVINLHIDTMNIAPGDSTILEIGNKTIFSYPTSGSYTYTVSAGSPNGFLDKHWADNVYARTRTGILTGIDPTEMKEQVKVFPNPASAFLTINCSGTEPVEEICFMNALGITVLRAVYDDNALEITIPTADYPAGRYTLILTMKGGARYVYPVMVTY